MTEPETPAYVLVILPAQHIRLPEVLRQIEAGKIVLVIKAKSAMVDRSFVRKRSYPALTSLDAAPREDLGAYRA